MVDVSCLILIILPLYLKLFHVRMLPLSFQSVIENHSYADKVPSAASLETDKAMILTFSEHATTEHHGPVIQDIFENFPRPIYEIAQIVAKDMAEKKGILVIHGLAL